MARTQSSKTYIKAPTQDDPRWSDIVERNTRADGSFVYAVTTTGIYCRPGCPSKRPHPENVEFHASADAAEQAGFRPCKRCNPRGPAPAAAQADKVAEACRLIEASIEAGETAPDLRTLARHAGSSPFHFHRIFKEHTGLTPKAYARAQREGRVRNELSTAPTVTDAIYAAGYSSNARFYETADDTLGMTPTTFRRGGASAEIRFAVGECALGSILVASSTRGICAILLGDDPDTLVRDLQDRFPKAELVGGDATFERLVAQVVGFVEAPGVGLNLPLDVRGTAFQQRVWQALRHIPPGDTVSYADIARSIGSPRGGRAVAAACSANMLAVAIPCHRVVRRDGSISGYRWGVERKRELLRRESAA